MRRPSAQRHTKPASISLLHAVSVRTVRDFKPDPAPCARQVKTKGARRITFEQFLMALAAVADAKKTSLEAVVRQALASQGPVSSGTRADYVKFHDDKVSRPVMAGQHALAWTC